MCCFIGAALARIPASHQVSYLIPRWKVPGPVINCTSPQFCTGVKKTT